MNKLNFLDVDKRKFPAINIIKKLPENNSLYETVLVTANDEFVKLFLEKKITYTQILKKTLDIINRNEFISLKKILPRNISDVINTSEKVLNKIRTLY